MSKLSPIAYKDFADIVGEANIADDDFIVNCHDWFGLGAQPKLKSLLGNPPIAVVMPADTEQVAALVKACNRHKIKFKAHSTGHGGNSTVPSENTISIDLRRMNKLEIDAESRMAVLEPYVTAGELMTEAHKQHLTCHVVGAGLVHSPLASATSFHGIGNMGNHTAMNFRNLLSLEWVTPEGDIVRIGSCDSTSGWFTGEGPGPGFRGMIRGIYGAAGGMGIFTKIGYKLYPWAGPAKLEWTGTHPQRGVAIPENFATYQVCWDNWEDATAATQKIQRTKVATLIARTPPDAVGHFLTATNREFYDQKRSGTMSALGTAETEFGWCITLMAWSKEEFEWKDSVLDDILQETKGRKVPITKLEAEILTANGVTANFVARFTRFAETAGVSLGILDSTALIPEVLERAKTDIGDISDPGGAHFEVETEQGWMWLNEGRHFWIENNPPTTRTTKRSLISAIEFILNSCINNEKKPLGFSGFIDGALAEFFGPKMGNTQEWMRKTKNTWDPNNLSDSAAYAQPKAPAPAKAWPIAKKFFFHPWGKPLFRKILAKQLKL